MKEGDKIRMKASYKEGAYYNQGFKDDKPLIGIIKKHDPGNSMPYRVDWIDGPQGYYYKNHMIEPVLQDAVINNYTLY
jgi:hypothetical protein